jgi:hypothetical protein
MHAARRGVSSMGGAKAAGQGCANQVGVATNKHQAAARQLPAAVSSARGKYQAATSSCLRCWRTSCRSAARRHAAGYCCPWGPGTRTCREHSALSASAVLLPLGPRYTNLQGGQRIVSQRLAQVHELQGSTTVHHHSVGAGCPRAPAPSHAMNSKSAGTSVPPQQLPGRAHIRCVRLAVVHIGQVPPQIKDGSVTYFHEMQWGNEVPVQHQYRGLDLTTARATTPSHIGDSVALPLHGPQCSMHVLPISHACDTPSTPSYSLLLPHMFPHAHVLPCTPRTPICQCTPMCPHTLHACDTAPLRSEARSCMVAATVSPHPVAVYHPMAVLGHIQM